MDKKTSGWRLRDLDLATKDEEMTWDRILEYSDLSEIGFMGDIAICIIWWVYYGLFVTGGAFPASTIVVQQLNLDWTIKPHGFDWKRGIPQHGYFHRYNDD